MVYLAGSWCAKQLASKQHVVWADWLGKADHGPISVADRTGQLPEILRLWLRARDLCSVITEAGKSEGDRTYTMERERDGFMQSYYVFNNV